MIRRALRAQLPALAHVFGLHPWDVERLTFAELREFHRYLEQVAKEG